MYRTYQFTLKPHKLDGYCETIAMNYICKESDNIHMICSLFVQCRVYLTISSYNTTNNKLLLIWLCVERTRLYRVLLS